MAYMIHSHPQYPLIVKAFLRIEGYELEDKDIAELCNKFNTALKDVEGDVVDYYELLLRVCNKVLGFLFYEEEYDGKLPEDYIDQAIDIIFYPEKYTNVLDSRPIKRKV